MFDSEAGNHAELKKNDYIESYESNDQIIVSADGDPWINPVFRNSSTDPELLTTIEKLQDNVDLIIASTVASKHINKLHTIDGQYNIANYHHINNNACIACLALHANLNDDEVTSDDIVNQLGKLTNAASSTASSTVLTELSSFASTEIPLFSADAKNIKPYSKNTMIDQMSEKIGARQHKMFTPVDDKTTLTSTTTSTSTSNSTSSNKSLLISTVGELTLPSLLLKVVSFYVLSIIASFYLSHFILANVKFFIKYFNVYFNVMVIVICIYVTSQIIDW